MALYGGAVGGYTTPDGRVVQLPANLATMFPSLQPQVQAPGPPPPGQQAPGGPPDLAAAMLPPMGQPSGTPPGAPDPMTALPLPAGTSPTWSPEDDAELAKQTAAAKQAQETAQLQDLAKKQGTSPATKRLAAAQESKPAQTNPDGTVSAKPLTNTDLASMGVATPTNQALAAEEQKKQAVGDKATADAEQAAAVAAAMKANQEADKKRLDAMQAEADRRQVQLDQHNADLMAQAKKISDTKIDRTADHPWLTAIGVALATLGTAMQNRDATLAAAFRGQAAPTPIENPGLKAMYSAIDRKVKAQMDDLDKQKDAYSLQQQAVTGERGIMKDRLDQLAAMRVGFLDQAKQEIDRITKETSVPGIKASGEIAKADISREQATTVATAQQRVQDQQNAEAARKQTMTIAGMQNATARRGQDIQSADTRRGQDVQLSISADTIAAQNQRTAAEIAQKLLSEGKTAAAAKMKLVGEQGIRDPRTGDFMLTPAGQNKMKQADAAEAQARAATDPNHAAALNQQAKDLRESAMTVDAAVADNPKKAEAAQKAADDAQVMANKTDLARRALEQDPSPANREAWAQLTARLTFIKAQAAKGLGERVSVRAMEALEDVLSINADSLWSRAVDKGKAIAAMNTLDTEFGQAADVALKGAGVKSGWTPSSPKNDAAFSGATAQEIADRSGSHGGGRLVDAAVTAAGIEPVGSTLKDQAYENAMGRTETVNGKPGRPNEYGLDPKDHREALGEIRRAGGAGHAEYGRIVDRLTAQLTNEKRPSLSKGLAQLVHDEDPKLFDALVDKVANGGGGGEVAAKRLREITAPSPGVRPAIRVPASLGSMSPEALKAYNEMLVKQGLPEVSQ